MVQTDGGRYAAERLVVTAGAWASRALADLGLPLTVRRKVLCWHAARDDALFRRDRFPVYMAEVPEGFFYGFPVTDGNGHKVARHDGGTTVADPSALDRTISQADETECRPFLDRYLPDASGPVRFCRVCMYTLTPDQHFVIDVHPGHPNVAIAAGFSGHGFKFASVVGEILADLAEKGSTPLPIDMFRLGRLRQ